MDADISRDARNSTIELRTDKKVLKASGAKLKLASDGLYDLLIDLPGNVDPAANEYRHAKVVVDFASR